MPRSEQGFKILVCPTIEELESVVEEWQARGWVCAGGPLAAAEITAPSTLAGGITRPQAQMLWTQALVKPGDGDTSLPSLPLRLRSWIRLRIPARLFDRLWGQLCDDE